MDTDRRRFLLFGGLSLAAGNTIALGNRRGLERRGAPTPPLRSDRAPLGLAGLRIVTDLTCDGTKILADDGAIVPLVQELYIERMMTDGPSPRLSPLCHVALTGICGPVGTFEPPVRMSPRVDELAALASGEFPPLRDSRGNELPLVVTSFTCDSATLIESFSAVGRVPVEFVGDQRRQFIRCERCGRCRCRPVMRPRASYYCLDCGPLGPSGETPHDVLEYDRDSIASVSLVAGDSSWVVYADADHRYPRESDYSVARLASRRYDLANTVDPAIHKGCPVAMTEVCSAHWRRSPHGSIFS